MLDTAKSPVEQVFSYKRDMLQTLDELNDLKVFFHLADLGQFAK